MRAAGAILSSETKDGIKVQKCSTLPHQSLVLRIPNDIYSYNDVSF